MIIGLRAYLNGKMQGKKAYLMVIFETNELLSSFVF
jgi:hypothetical protein